MPARKITVPVTPDMQKTLDELCELHALQLPSLASMLLRDALAGRRSALLPKRAPTPPNGAGSNDVTVPAGHGTPSEESRSGAAWSLLGRRPQESAGDEAQELSGRRRRPKGLTSVRRSNGPYSFPVSRFHRGVARGFREGTSEIKRTSPYSPMSLRSGRCLHPPLRHRL